MRTFELIAPCHFGLESVLKREIQDLGYDVTFVEDGKVTFLADAEGIARANVFLRTAERVLIKVGKFKAETYDEEVFFGWKFIQYEFFTQWAKIKEYANNKGISIVGDIPIYVSPDSADLWANPELFAVDPETYVPDRVAGCPPDAFSPDGQLWGNPLYDWDYRLFSAKTQQKLHCDFL